MFRRKLGDVKKLSRPSEEISKEKDESFKIPTLCRQRTSHERQRKLLKTWLLLPTLQSLPLGGASPAIAENSFCFFAQ